MDDLTVPTPEVSQTTDPVVHRDGDDICVVARYPYQMAQCQEAMIEWSTMKIVSVKGEFDDLAENVEIARKNGWGTAALIRARDRARTRLTFYEKIKMALEAGHCIVPNFPVQMIAIRTKRTKPLNLTGRWFNDAARPQTGESMAAGQGEYQNPVPLVRGPVEATNEKGEPYKYYFASEYQEVDFPFITAKPQILSAAARAMADKVFDEIGVLPGRQPKGDPIIVGRIHDRSRGKFSERTVTFLIAWYVDTKDL